jgi:hypothetical protein
MFANSIRRATTIATLFAAASAAAWPQAELQPLHEIHLPISSSRGSFNHFPYSEMTAREHFALRIAPDQRNDTTCHDVLQATVTSSVQALETLIDRGQDVLPPDVLHESTGR